MCFDSFLHIRYFVEVSIRGTWLPATLVILGAHLWYTASIGVMKIYDIEIPFLGWVHFHRPLFELCVFMFLFLGVRNFDLDSNSNILYPKLGFIKRLCFHEIPFQHSMPNFDLDQNSCLRIIHPPSQDHFYRWYRIRFPVMGGLWHCSSHTNYGRNHHF